MVLYEDNHLLIVNKPAGMLVQADTTGDATLMDWGKKYIKEKYEKPGDVFLGCVHRLDRPVGGVVVLARTSKALVRMNQLFADRNVLKTYWAVCLEQPKAESGRLRHFLVKDSVKNIVKAYERQEPGSNAKESLLDYRWINTIGDRHLLEINPLTGRPHQIRVQLASMGCPIAGDLKYGALKPLPDANIALHCVRLEFEHPVLKTNLRIEAPLPPSEVWAGF